MRSVIKEQIEADLRNFLHYGPHRLCEYYSKRMRKALREDSKWPGTRKFLLGIVKSSSFLAGVVRPLGDEAVRMFHEDLGLKLDGRGGGYESVWPETSSWTGSMTDTVGASAYCPSETGTICADWPEVMGEDEVKSAQGLDWV